VDPAAYSQVDDAPDRSPDSPAQVRVDHVGRRNVNRATARRRHKSPALRRRSRVAMNFEITPEYSKTGLPRPEDVEIAQ